MFFACPEMVEGEHDALRLAANTTHDWKTGHASTNLVKNQFTRWLMTRSDPNTLLEASYADKQQEILDQLEEKVS